MLAWPVSRAMLVAVCGVAQRGHELRSGAKPDPRGVFTLGDVADVVDAVLDGPVPLQPVGEEPAVGPSVIQGGDCVHDLHRGLACADASPADDLDRPAGAWEQRLSVGAVQVDDLDRAGLGPAMSAPAATGAGSLRPRKAHQLLPQQRLVALDG